MVRKRFIWLLFILFFTILATLVVLKIAAGTPKKQTAYKGARLVMENKRQETSCVVRRTRL